MSEYCTEIDVRNRLTANGYLNLGDRDGDGVVNQTEVSAYITTAIEWAGAEIDYALINHEPAYELETARSSGNIFLRSRCVDLAAWQVASHGGRDVPTSFQFAFDRTTRTLDDIRENRAEVPGLDNGSSTFMAGSHQTFETQSLATT